MPTELYKVLGQANPSGGVLTDLYTVPANTEAVISSIVIAHVGGGVKSYMVAIAIGGAADNLKQRLVENKNLSVNATDTLVIGITLAAGDIIRVESNLGSVAFNVFGTEITP